MSTSCRDVVLGTLLLCAVMPLQAFGEDEEPSEDETPAFTTTIRGRPPPEGASEYVVDQTLVQATSKRDAADTLELVPGLVVSRHGGQGKAQQFFLRGFDAVHGQDIEISVAGVPVNEVSHIHAQGYADLGFVVPEVIGDITAYEGPYRADQGDFAIAGSVRLSLRAPGPGAFGELSLGQFGFRRLMAGMGAQDPRTFAVAELAQGQGYGPARSFFRSTVLAQGERRMGDVVVRSVVGAYTARFSSPGVVSFRDEEAGRMDFFGTYDAHQGGTSERMHLMLEAASPNDRTAATGYVVRQNLRLKNNFTGFWFDPKGDGLEQVNDTTTIGFALRTAERFNILGLPLRLRFGAGARHDMIDESQRGYQHADQAPIRDPGRSFALSLSQTNLYAYGRALASPGAWELTFGIRTDALAARIEPRDGTDLLGARRSALGARVGFEGAIARKLGDSMKLILQYGDGFRSPHAASLADGERAPFVAVHGGELGFRYDTRYVVASIAGFTSWVANDIFFDHATSTSISVGPTLRTGGTASALVTIPQGLQLLASGTVAHAAQLDTRTELPGFIPYVGRFDASWHREVTFGSVPLRFEAGTSLMAVGPRPLRFGDTGSGYVLNDLRLSVGYRRVSLRFDLSNLFDVRWTDGEFTYPSHFPTSPPSSLPQRHFTAGEPRTAQLSLVLHPRSP